MASTVQFDLVSPERRLASFAATEVQIPGAMGDMTAMEGHAATITSLRPGVLRVIGADGVKSYIVTGGFAEISATGVSVLAEQAVPLAKGLGSGVPIGAVVVGPQAKDVLGPGNHGTTFGGNPLAMRAGVETLRIMEEDGLMAHAAAVGEVLREALQAGLAGEQGVVEFRGQGLMIGIELARPCGVLLNRAADAGLLISVTADRVVRLLPPLILSADEARQIAAILCPLIKAFLAEPT